MKYLSTALLRLFALLPLPINHAVGTCLGWLYFYLSKRDRRIARINIARCFPELSSRQQQRLVKNSFLQTGKNVTELAAVFLWPAGALWSKLDPGAMVSLLREQHAKGRGVILASPHLGCWELLGLYYSHLYPITSLYRPPKMQQFEQIIRSARQRFGANLVPTERSGIKQMHAALNRGELVGILPDQDPGKRGNGIFAPYFGHSAKTMALLVRLAQKYRAPVIFSFIERLPRGHGYRLHAIVADETFFAATVEHAVAMTNQYVEQCVRMAPAQYQWTYKRFRSRPEGEASFY